MSGGSSRYLVGFVVVLWVVLEDLGPLLVVEGTDQLLDADASVLVAPLLAVLEPVAPSATTLFGPHAGDVHLLGELNVELARSEEA